MLVTKPTPPLDRFAATAIALVEGLLWGQATLRPPAPVYLLLKKEDSTGKSEEWAVRCRRAEPVEGVFELGMEAVHRLAGK